MADPTLESADAAISAAAAAVASAVAEASAGLSDFARARVIIEAGFTLMEAARVLFFDLLAELFLWALANPRLASCVAAAPASFLAFRAAQALANRSWKQGLRDDFVQESLDASVCHEFPAGRFERAVSARPASQIQQHLPFESLAEEEHEDDPEPDALEPSQKHAKVEEETVSTATSPTAASPDSGFPHEASDSLLAPCSALAGLGEECLAFLTERTEIIDLQAGASLFERGCPRDAFIMVKSGQVIVHAHDSSRDEYILVAGDIAVGLLFVLASIDTSSNVSSPDSYLHCSSARAGASGAEVISLPTSAFAEAYDRFPAQMLSMTQLLCTRLGLVVFETLSTYFGIREEVFAAPKPPDSTDSPSDSGTPTPAFAEMRPTEIFAHLFDCACDDSDARVVEIFNSAKVIEREPHEQILPRSQRSPHVLVLLEGELHMEVPGGPGLSKSFLGDVSAADVVAAGVQGAPGTRRIPPGDVIGELSVFTDRPSPTVYTASTRCRFAALSRDSMHKLLELRPRLCCLKIIQRIATQSASWLHRVDAALDWIHLEGGRCLYRRGDPMRGFYVVLSGRLMALEESISEAGSKWQVVDSMQRGRLCGELDCLRNEPYSQMVRAARDTEVCRISPTLLNLVANEFPRGILHFSALLGRTSEAGREAPKSGNGERERATIAVVPATRTVPVNEVCSQLSAALGKIAKTLHISPDMDLASPGLQGIPTSSEHKRFRTADDGRIARALCSIEERCHWVIYEAEPTVSAWTRRCIRQADLILVVIDFDGRSSGDVPPTAIENYVAKVTSQHVERHLLMLHPSPSGKPSSRLAETDLLRPGLRGLLEHHTMRITGGWAGNGRMRSARHYLHARPWARRWYHVRAGEAGDWARCGRLLVGRGIGLCLGGGGARGNVHLGLIRAMQELNIPIDVVSGTSFGALVGGIYAMTAADPASMPQVIRRVMGTEFSTKRLMMDMNFPRTSYFTGGFLNHILQHTFARRRCEDLLIPFACTSTDIAHFNSRLHRDGPLWRIVRASMSLVGLVPPLPYSEKTGPDGQDVVSLLVDGGYTNQWPVKELRELGAGTVFCAVASPDYEPICKDYGDTVSGGLVAVQRRCSCRKRLSVADPPTLSEIQERLMFLVDALKEQSGEASTKVHADLMLRPPISDFGLLDFQKYAELDEIGYKYSMPELQKWLSESSAAARWVREVIETEKQVDYKLRRSLHETEYGGRRAYRLMRQKTGSIIKRASAELRSKADELRCKAGSIRDTLSPAAALLSPRVRGVSPLGQWRRSRSPSPEAGDHVWRLSPWQRGRSHSPDDGLRHSSTQ